ncbi:hypothetical protein DPMN_049135 [Dreissena polymorpha]|uniref:Uncharacterized protein n=1 Tax=Dreissena polymorpha TaxID=45954 RepID=A0A9D4DBA1_DREPO|nr:hypothetical protein DPMN_049135 [Dreissena polymorpha]
MGCTYSLAAANEKEKLKHIWSQSHKANIVLTESDKHSIKNSSQLVSNNMPAVGANIFLRIFALNQHVKELFPFRDVLDD